MSPSPSPEPILAKQRYRARQDIPAAYLTISSRPAEGSGKAVFPAGEVFVVERSPGRGDDTVEVRPENYAAVERLIIPATEPDYAYFLVLMPIEALRGRCDLLASSQGTA